MPCRFRLVRQRSKSRCKHLHSHSHEIERTYKSNCSHPDDWSDDSDDDDDDSSDSSFGDRGCEPWGRPFFPVYIDGRNASQQNIQIQGCCRQDRTRTGCGSGSPDRIMICPSDSHDLCCAPAVTRRPCRPYGCPCCQGCGSLQSCNLCPASGRLRLSTSNQSQQCHEYYALTGDDGKVEFYQPSKLHKHLINEANAYEKAGREEREGQEKRRSEAFDVIRRLQRQHLLPRGHSLSESWSPSRKRSTEEIRSDLAEVKANLEQLHLKNLLEAQSEAEVNEREEMLDRRAICSGALQAFDEQDYGRLKRLYTASKRRPGSTGHKKVNFAVC